MTISTHTLAGAALLAVTACAPAATQGAPATPAPAAAARPDTARLDADARFMQHMIAHHAQALEMTALVNERTPSQDVRLMAERMEVSQRDEIATMQRWLRGRGLAVPDARHAHHDAAHASMPGMLSASEMQRLAAARGAEFDRLFLELMIRHHEGALVMVRDLLASPGGGQRSDTFQVAAEVESDQQAEIGRMRALLAARAPAAPR